MNQLQTFNNQAFGELEILIKNGKEFFPATDVAIKLGYADPYKAISQHTKQSGWAIHPVIDSLGRTQQKKFIDEGNLYRLIARSKLPDAEKFESWVFDEVLPSIRKHGAYATPQTIENILNDPDFGIQLLTTLKEERHGRLKAEKERDHVIEQRKAELPYTNFGKIVSNSNGAISVGAFAKMMYDQHGMRIGRNKMFDWLRDNGYLMKGGREHNNPKQIYIQQGWFEVKPTIVSRSEGDVERLTTLITGKGQVRLAELLLKQRKAVI